MSGNVIAFDDGEDLSPELLQQELVNMLEELLVRAKAGSVTSMACTILRSDGTIGTRWTQTHNPHSLGFGITMLQHDYCRDLRGAQ